MERPALPIASYHRNRWRLFSCSDRTEVILPAVKKPLHFTPNNVPGLAQFFMKSRPNLVYSGRPRQKRPQEAYQHSQQSSFYHGTSHRTLTCRPPQCQYVSQRGSCLSLRSGDSQITAALGTGALFRVCPGALLRSNSVASLARRTAPRVFPLLNAIQKRGCAWTLGGSAVGSGGGFSG